MQFLDFPCLKKRSLITLGLVAATITAHAGSIQISQSSYFNIAATDTIVDSPSGSGIAPGYIQTSATETTSLGSGTALSQVQVDCEGTTLTGFSQSDVASSANNNKKFRSASLASHDVTFDITAKSTVSYSLKANATYTGSTDKGGKGWSADSSASVSLYKWDGASFSLVKRL